MLLRRQGGFYGLDQGFEVEGAVVALAVDEEGGGAVDAAANAPGEIFADPFGERFVLERLGQVGGVEIQVSGQFLVQFRTKVDLILKKLAVHGPELSLGAGKFGGLGRGFGFGVDLGEGKVAEDEAQLVAKMLLDAGDDTESDGAMRAFVVAVFNQCDGGIVAALYMVFRADRDFEGAHLATSVFRASSASRMPSAPGLTPMGEQ